MERKEAIEVIKNNWPNSSFTMLREALETLIPELKESDGNGIIKDMIETIKKEAKDFPSSVIAEKSKSWIAWLEKQGEKKLYGQREECLDCQSNYAGECKGFCAMKRGEQKPVDKIEPKFHEGDWIVYNNDICQIVKREEGCNKLVTVFGIEKELVNERNLSTARLWTIEDAKDGDVLVMQKTNVTYESIFIFNKIENNQIIQYLHYFTTDTGEEICEARSIDGFLGFVGTTVHPATKEQRDTLMNAMAYAGYEWDAEHKQLRTIVKDENDMNYIDFDKLTELAKPLQLYVTDTIHPNVTIIITPSSIKVCEDIAFTNT